jgi:serine/threonine protein kinase
MNPNPQPFGKYQLLKKLATGGMAEVWLARQTGIEGFAKNLVVKRILPHLAEDREFVEMFRNEALIAARFNHPNIAQVYEFGEANGNYYIAMEYIHGEDLGRVMRKAWEQNQWVARPLAIRIVAAACEGLYYAHSRTDESGRPLRVVHRDISPQNILISFDGSVKLVDFGIAKAADQASLTRSGAIKGKFAYMAPEQASGKPLDCRADVFSIGLVLYELLTGVRPLKRDTELATLQAALECAIPPPSEVADVPPELDSVVMQALSKSIDSRYRDARQFQLALEEFLVSQRWVASSVQVSELMEALFSDRLEEERRSGSPEPSRVPTDEPATPVELPPHVREDDEPFAATVSRAAPRPERSASSDMQWEAPPGELPQQRSRTGQRSSLRMRTGAMRALPPPVDEEELAAPPSEADELPPMMDVPTRLTSENMRAVQGARTLSRSDEEDDEGTVAEKPTARRTGQRQALDAAQDSGTARRTGQRQAVTPPAPARPSRTSAVAALAKDPEATQLPEEEPQAPRRRTGATGMQPQLKRGASRADMPEAPPRRQSTLERQQQALVDEDETRETDEALDDAPDLTPVPVTEIRKPKPWENPVIVAVVCGVVVLLTLLFREPLARLINASSLEAQPVFLTVKAEPGATAYVQHRSGCGDSDAPVELGNTPLTQMSGAHMEDLLILDNPAKGLHKELEIPSGEPGATQMFEVKFPIGYFRPKLMVRNRPMPEVYIYREGTQVGLYQAGQRLELSVGSHSLELRGDALRGPVPLSVTVTENNVTENDWLDLTGQLQ